MKLLSTYLPVWKTLESLKDICDSLLKGLCNSQFKCEGQRLYYGSTTFSYLSLPKSPLFAASAGSISSCITTSGAGSPVSHDLHQSKSKPYQKRSVIRGRNSSDNTFALEYATPLNEYRSTTKVSPFQSLLSITAL